MANNAFPINIVPTCKVSQIVLNIGFTGPFEIENIEDIRIRNVEKGVTNAPKILSLNLIKKTKYTNISVQEKKDKEDLKSSTGAVPKT